MVPTRPCASAVPWWYRRSVGAGLGPGLTPIRPTPFRLSCERSVGRVPVPAPTGAALVYPHDRDSQQARAEPAGRWHSASTTFEFRRLATDPAACRGQLAALLGTVPTPAPDRRPRGRGPGKRYTGATCLGCRPSAAAVQGLGDLQSPRGPGGARDNRAAPEVCQSVSGRVRGSPKRVMTLVLKLVMAVMWSPAVVMTRRQ